MILSAHGLGYAWPGGVPALDGADLAVRRGGRLAVLGPNGCGKTTLLLHLNGTLRPQRGEVRLEGQPIGYDRRSLRELRQRVGLILQDPDDQLFGATVAQDVAFGPTNLGLGAHEVRRRVEAALTALGITDLADRPPHRLSLGQKRRAAIAGVLAMRPLVLLLDEPTAGLDADGGDRLLAALDGVAADGTTLVIATHDIDFAYAWADTVAVCAEARVVCQGETTAVLGDPAALAAGRLKPPLVLEVARALADAGHVWPDGRLPRRRDELVAAVAATRPRTAGTSGPSIVDLLRQDRQDSAVDVDFEPPRLGNIDAFRPAAPEPLTPEMMAELEALAALPDSTIDTSDIPPVTDWAGAKRGALYRPVERLLSLRLDADVVDWFKVADAKGYQSRINAALREYVERHRHERD